MHHCVFYGRAIGVLARLQTVFGGLIAVRRSNVHFCWSLPWSAWVLAAGLMLLAAATWATPKPPTPEWSEQETKASGREDGSAEAVATFAGGCFWCMEPPFDALDGVLNTISGYTGGHLNDPTYPQVTRGDTGHYEAVQVIYDPTKVGYAELLQVFWRNIDPVDATGQFCDKGAHYRSAIFVHNASQMQLADQSRTALENSGVLPGPVVTEIVPATRFYAAEEYHQNYYQKNPLRYRFYRTRCGRDQRLQELWGEQP